MASPREDFEQLYDDEYYEGKGADPLVDYVYETEHAAETVRTYEWTGILKAVSKLHPVDQSTRWLDYGCGLGGLVTFLVNHGVPAAVGYEQGWGCERLRLGTVPHIADERSLSAMAGAFDVVTAIEVIEHTLDPVAELKRIRQLLKPGGILFLTTGNAEPFRDRLDKWSYVMPDIHVSYFEPENLALALTKAGFRCENPGRIDGWSDIIRYKVLKTMRVKRRNMFEAMVPWPLAAAVIDRRLFVSAHPVGWAD